LSYVLLVTANLTTEYHQIGSVAYAIGIGLVEMMMATFVGIKQLMKDNFCVDVAT
jgi:hypothetical protein